MYYVCKCKAELFLMLPAPQLVNTQVSSYKELRKFNNVGYTHDGHNTSTFREVFVLGNS